MRAITIEESIRLMSLTQGSDINSSDDELEISENDSVEDLINVILLVNRMTKKNITPLLHTKDEYENAKRKALKYLAKKGLSKKEIDQKLNEGFVNEAFDVLTWSRKNLPKMIADDIEEAHEGGFGEKFQTSLLKIVNKEELLQWYNKNFEVGEIMESEVAEDHPWNQIYSKVENSIKNGIIDSEDKLESLIRFLIRHGEYNLAEDDIEDAAWAAWSDRS